MTTPASTTPVAASPQPRRAQVVLWSLILSAFVCNINLSVANVALPAIGSSLGASQSQLTLIATGCSLGLAMSVLYLGALGDRYGRKLMLLLGLAITIPASVLCALAPSATILAAGRILTGVAAGMAYPTTLALITALWAPGARRVKAIALWSGIGGGAAVLGPVFAGLLLEEFWWGSVFLVVVPVALLAAPLVWFFVPGHVNESRAKVDHAGGILSVFMIACLVLGVGVLPSPGLLFVGVGLLAGAFVFAAAFIWRERSTPQPLYDLHYASRRLFWVAAIAGIIVFGSLMGSLFVGQQFLQEVLGYSTAKAGFSILPAALGMAGAAPISARLVNSRGSRVTLIVGILLVLSAFLLMLVFWKEQTAYAWVGIAYLLVGMGAGIALTPASQSLTASVPVTRVGMASGTTDLQRDLGGSVMQALMGSLLTIGYASTFSQLISGSSEASSISQQTQTMLLQSFSGAAQVAQQYPQYQAQILQAARQSFLDGANWAYGAAVLAAIGAVVIVAWRFPGKAGEERLLADYARQDADVATASS